MKVYRSIKTIANDDRLISFACDQCTERFSRVAVVIGDKNAHC
jgi:hypothetical protein